MGKRPTHKDYIGGAARAMSDINILYAIIALSEGSFLHSESHGAAQRIVKICRAEAGRRLKHYDAAVAAALKQHKDGE